MHLIRVHVVVVKLPAGPAPVKAEFDNYGYTHLCSRQTFSPPARGRRGLYNSGSPQSATSTVSPSRRADWCAATPMAIYRTACQTLISG